MRKFIEARFERTKDDWPIESRFYAALLERAETDWRYWFYLNVLKFSYASLLALNVIAGIIFWLSGLTRIRFYDSDFFYFSVFVIPIYFLVFYLGQRYMRAKLVKEEEPKLGRTGWRERMFAKPAYWLAVGSGVLGLSLMYFQPQLKIFVLLVGFWFAVIVISLGFIPLSRSKEYGRTLIADSSLGETIEDNDSTSF